ncbi:hypothetical protein [Nocardia jinanensis]|uniref:hypothetical protein n=1 Tax=Nocardia jinanensis TaxID=382504 RepID=UPI000AD6FA88|nr:hypothetical protein [Nocardia jinanensis]
MVFEANWSRLQDCPIHTAGLEQLLEGQVFRSRSEVRTRLVGDRLHQHHMLDTCSAGGSRDMRGVSTLVVLAESGSLLGRIL